jgi:hypothetical protein
VPSTPGTDQNGKPDLSTASAFYPRHIASILSKDRAGEPKDRSSVVLVSRSVSMSRLAGSTPDGARQVCRESSIPGKLNSELDIDGRLSQKQLRRLVPP